MSREEPDRTVKGTPGREGLRPTPWRNAPVEHDYSRRPGGGTSPDDKRASKIFRGNRGLMITLIDVVIVAIIFVIFYTILEPLSQAVVIAPYRVTIDSRMEERALIVEAVVHHRKPTIFSTATDDPGELMQPVVTIGLDDGEPSISDLAPREGERRRMELVVAREHIENMELFSLNVQIGNERRVYIVDLR